MIENLNDFIKPEMLYSFVGLISATLIFTEGLKKVLEILYSMFKLGDLPNTVPQLIAVIFPIIILIYTAVVTGGSFIEYIVAIINGFGVALSAMKSFELVKTRIDTL